MDQGVPFRPLEGVGIGAAFGASQERLKDMRRSAESLLDPLGMVAPILHAQHAWWCTRWSSGSSPPASAPTC